MVLGIATRALHMTARGLVARGSTAPRMGQMILDSSDRRIGNVADVFGPVNQPYFMVRPASGVTRADLARLVGSELRMGELYAKSRKSEKMSRMRRY
jgi:rRNA processing protein Gar1